MDFGVQVGIDNSGVIVQGPGANSIVGIGSQPVGVSPAIGIELGTWTDDADLLDLGDEIIIPSEVVVNTFGGDDVIIGRDGIVNLGTLETGEGNDAITGSGGIVGISNFGTIKTGEGNDTITGSGGVVGIDNFGIIDTGNGDDVIVGSTGSGAINLGQGDDLIQGVSGQFVDGGPGFDTAELGIDYDENLISIGITGPTSIEVTSAGSTISFDNLELWDFNGQEFTLEQIQDLF